MAADERVPEMTLPTDAFTVAFRQLQLNPGAAHASGRVDIADFYGRRETWNIDTFREQGNETVFVQKQAATGALRLVLPPEVMAVINRKHDQVTTVARRRGARQAVETKRAQGQTVGNPAALRKARKARRARKGAK